MVVTATRFKTNIGHYLDAVPNEEIYITKNGKIAARLSYNTDDKLSILNSLVGITKGNSVSFEEAKAERILRRAYPDLYRNNSGALKEAKDTMLTESDEQ